MTFRPYADHARSARVLDDKRLGKQRVEAMQIMSAMMAKLTGETGGWTNHPIVNMWAGLDNPYIDHACGQLHLRDLLDYYYACRDEWRSRGFKHQMDYKILPFSMIIQFTGPWQADHQLPWTSADEKRHKQILLRKDPDWYGQFWKRRPVLQELRVKG